MTWPDASGRHRNRSVAAAGMVSLLAGCSGPQSALDPAGLGAERIADLFAWMAAGAVVIWLVVIGLSVHAVRARAGSATPGAVNLLLVWGGGVFPTVVLAALLLHGLPLMSDLTSAAPAGSLRIAVHGEQWWWRVPSFGMLPGEELLLLAGYLDGLKWEPQVGKCERA
jgi:cytochrome c oxidase subunit 2